MKKLIALLLLAAVAIVIFFSSAFIVDEKKQAFVTQFGEPVGEPIAAPGIHFKLPIIQKVRFFDRRFLEWDGHPNQVPTRDKLYISIDTYARWRIKDPLKFFQNLNDELGAQTRLDDILDGATRNAVARHDLVEIVRSTHRELSSLELTNSLSQLSTFSVGRDVIAQDVLKHGGEQLENWGIELLDIRFKRINYSDAVRQVIYERMISERQQIADKFRSEGQGAASEILGQRERELRTIQSAAFRQAQEIQGRADAEAAAIYADAYDKNPEAREFYRFLKSMETYETTLKPQDWLLLSTKNDFYQYLGKSRLEPAAQENPAPAGSQSAGATR